MATLLIIDDEKNMRWLLERTFKSLGHQVITAADGREGLDAVRAGRPDLVLTDLKMPGLDGMAVLQQIKELQPELPVIVITAYGSVETAIAAMKLGAVDYITKPFDVEEMKILVEKALAQQSLRREVAYLREELQEKTGFGDIVGTGEKMRQVFDLIARVAPSHASVLITGESGTGKELVARAIHAHSPRRDGPFIQVNCAALPETLLESELFGHEKGAFTGAVARRLGRFELANGGTLFLDEIGEMSPTVQAKLLRVLQDKTFERVGGIDTIRVNVRIVAATNRDLAAMIKEGTFREDLYYRLNVVRIHLPPLRERREDIPLLVRRFLRKYDPKGRYKEVTAAAMSALTAYRWPGNIRELENVIERATIITPGEVIGLEQLPPEITCPEAPAAAGGFCLDIPATGISLDEVERTLLQKALDMAGGNQTKAAKLLGISRYALIYRLEKHGLKAEG